ncbi:ribosome maturation factor RimM [Sediminispirochaeta smaragdinae]|uniref:Ribosome maturation factor RimM n=1 Tax=Sediminispirochaeta smaragdinae (strain DSM 11293 / JCM 15392 / SEBR 4228) TaxID=573413 RepID=E1R6I2_SEDSS|nr:ribosome maturation factor RimM [Sediminispirochaeta smaragdinae]ADK81000.1 16S rRNA processing protein RimM [Sediminispirochaeta smaragdinae DSM 11293]
MDTVVIGKVRTSHGVRGLLKVRSLSGETGHFLALKEVVLKRERGERSFVVESVRVAGSDLLMKLRGIDSPEEGKLWAGADMIVSKELGAALREDEYYYSDLIGCAVVCRGSEVGTIVSIVENGVSDLLEVKTDGGKWIVPFQKHFVGSVDLVSRTVELLEPGLLE